MTDPIVLILRHSNSIFKLNARLSLTAFDLFLSVDMDKLYDNYLFVLCISFQRIGMKRYIEH